MKMGRLTTKTIGLLLAVDIVFKALITLSLCGMLGIDRWTDRRTVAGLTVLVGTPLVLAWIAAFTVLLRPIERALAEVRRGAAPSLAAGRAVVATYRTPQRAAVAWALHWVALYTAVPLLLRAGIPRPLPLTPDMGAGVALFVLAMLGGGLALAFTFVGWMLAPAAGELSLAARRAKTVVAARGLSVRGRLILVALCLGLTPLVWMGSFSYMNEVRATRTDAARTATALPTPLETAPAVRSSERTPPKVLPPHSFFFAFGIFVLGVGLWAPLCAALLAATLAGPVSRIADVIRAITLRGDPAHVDRVPVFQPDELGALSETANQMIDKLELTAVALAQASRELVEKKRLERELEIAARIQTCLLPRAAAIEGLEVAAVMRPADEVGGDYFDLIPTKDGGWIGVGDVSGHGLTAGLIMLMAQSAVATAVKSVPPPSPREVLIAVNSVLFENIRRRLVQTDFLTISLLRYHRDGRVILAGAHEEIVVFRAARGTCEHIPTPGTWLGGMSDVADGLQDSTFKLEDGDLLVLHTDGITEAMNATSVLFGLERLSAAIGRVALESVEKISASILKEVAAWRTVQRDDETLLVFRYRAPAGSSNPLLG